MRENERLMKIMLLMIIVLAVMSIYQSIQAAQYQFYFTKMIWTIDTLQRDWLTEHYNYLYCKKGTPL